MTEVKERRFAHWTNWVFLYVSSFYEYEIIVLYLNFD